MKRLWIVVLLLGAAPQAVPDRSPGDLALSADGRWALTSNRTSNSVSLVDLVEGKVTAEIPVGRAPYGIDWKGSVAVVAHWRDDSVTILDVAPPKLSAASTVLVGNEPRGVALSLDGARAFIVVSGENAVDVLEVKSRKVLQRIPVGSEPWYAALAPDGARLAVGNSLGGSISLIDTATLKVAATVPIQGRNLRRLAVSSDGAWAYVPHITDRGSPITLQNIEKGLVIDNRIGRVAMAGDVGGWGLGLDTRGFGAADPEGLAISPDGTKMAVTLGGIRNLLLLSMPLPLKAEPGEFIDDSLLGDPKRYRRVGGLRGRPMGCAFTPDGRSVIIANYLANEVQIVDWATAEVARTIPLGGPKEPSLTRQGEKIFCDAFKCWHEWYSCNTCHSEGHSNGGLYDTFNDGRYGNPKKTLSLRGVGRTGPWTWHGHQTDLGQSLQSSFTKTMARPGLNAQDLAAVLAYVQTIDYAPAPRGLPEASVRRGEAVFKEKACDACHAPPDYTVSEVMLVGLESPDDVYKGFNPPSLHGVTKRGPWLHDGRAKTLQEVLMQHHRPLKLNGKPDLTPAELSDLLAFLKSL